MKPIDQRKTNVDFGDALSNFTTTYKYQYDAKQVDPQRKAADTSHASNLMFGNNSPEYVTSHGESYVPIVAPVQQAGKRNYLNNIEFGTGDNGYISEKQHQYAAKPMEQREVVAKETIQDFRSAHFQFGFG